METAYMENITVIFVPNTEAVFVGRSHTCWLSVVILSIETVQTCVLICVCVCNSYHIDAQIVQYM